MIVCTRHVRSLLAAVVATATALGGGMAASASTAPTSTARPSADARSTTSPGQSQDGKLLLMLDASGSMKEKDPSGGTKMDAAKQALSGVVEELPTDATVGLRVYGATEEGGTPTKAACADTQLVAPIATLDKPALTTAIKGFEAKGETPIAHSLEKGLKDLGTKGKRNIVLVSDGEESCVPDPCPVIKKLVKDGVDLQIDTVGFDVKGTARKQLQCIADTGDGTYYDAKDADELAASLTKVSQRAIRGFTVDGDRIRATESAAKAPTIKPGRYTDTIPVSSKARHVRLSRTPGSTVHFSLVSRPPNGRETLDTEKWSITLSTPDGEECDRQFNFDIKSGGQNSAITVSATANNAVPQDDTADDPCAMSRELVAKIEHDEGLDATVPTQLLYVEQPAVSDVASLPAGLDAQKVRPVQATGGGSPEPVVGGGGFGDAAPLDPGSYRETILPGEQLYYRVRLDYGQSAAFSAGIATTGPQPELDSSDHQFFAVEAWSPTLHDLTRSDSTTLDNRDHLSKKETSMTLGEHIPEVRYRNKESDTYQGTYDELNHVSLPGYYYFSIERESVSDGPEAIPLEVEIDVDVDG
ncbi:MAG: vWA domain-containing protein, partial [Janibacter sp.]